MQIPLDASVAIAGMLLYPDEQGWPLAEQYRPADSLARRDVARLERWVDRRLLEPERALADYREAMLAIAKLPDDQVRQAIAAFAQGLRCGRPYAKDVEWRLKPELRSRLKHMMEHYASKPAKGIRARHWEALEALLEGREVSDDFEEGENA